VTCSHGAVHEHRACFVKALMVLGLVAAAVVLVLAKVPWQTAMGVVFGGGILAAVTYRIAEGKQIPQWLRAQAAQMLAQGLPQEDPSGGTQPVSGNPQAYGGNPQQQGFYQQGGLPPGVAQMKPRQGADGFDASS
jgi:hypothetical protein